jgi:hypothetical protein
MAYLVSPRTYITGDPSIISPFINTYDAYLVSGLGQNTTVNAPSGTPSNFQPLSFRFLDTGVARLITWNAIYTGVGVTMPTGTTANKHLHIGSRYNQQRNLWEILATAVQAN